MNYSRKAWQADEAQQITKDRWGGVATSILSKSPAFTGMKIRDHKLANQARMAGSKSADTLSLKIPKQHCDVFNIQTTFQAFVKLYLDLKNC